MWMGHCIKPLFSADEEETGVYLLQAERAENSALFFFVCLFFFSIKKNKLGRKRNLIAAQIELFPRFLHRLLRRITFLLNKNVIEVSTWKILSLAKMFPGPRKGTKIMQKSSRLLLFFFFFSWHLKSKRSANNASLYFFPVVWWRGERGFVISKVLRRCFAATCLLLRHHELYCCLHCQLHMDLSHLGRDEPPGQVSWGQQTPNSTAWG